MIEPSRQRYSKDNPFITYMEDGEVVESEQRTITEDDEEEDDEAMDETEEKKTDSSAPGCRRSSS